MRLSTEFSYIYLKAEDKGEFRPRKFVFIKVANFSYLCECASVNEILPFCWNQNEKNLWLVCKDEKGPICALRGM